jgi:type VI secretion system secreted protein VgrG
MPHPITLTSPLQAEDIRFGSMAFSEGLSALGEMQLTLVSNRADIRPEDLLGKPMAVKMEMRGGTKRYFHGYVTRFGLGNNRGRYYGYTATVRPWLWFLTRTTDCKIFQDLSVPDIVKKVFQDHGIANFEFKLFRSYRTWTYCVQYRESDFNFISRLLEHEGIYWYFEHSDTEHKLVLVDSQSSHDTATGCETLPYFANASSAPPDHDFVQHWTFAREVSTGKVATTSYDFERPSASLVADRAIVRAHDLADYELFDYQGDYAQADDGTHWSDNRIDELHCRFEQLNGTTNAQALRNGQLFKLERHPREDQNGEYLVTRTTIHAHQDSGEAGSGDHGYSCDFKALPSGQQYRPARRTPKPFVQGPQTAVVVGPAGDEIFTDKYGRVKVQFHWDRYGQKNEKSSCWVRVSSPWAGKSFGFIQVPRIGQEVVVGFLEGDPDQPLITGRVYNAEQMPPWDLPANATQSGMLTRSSKGGAYSQANAIRFEDKKGGEQLWIHAEKDQDIEVENDETHSVGHDRAKSVGNNETTSIGANRTESVGKDESISIGVNRTESVGANETISIGANRSITVGASETATVALQRTHSVGVNETIAIGAAQEIAIGAAQVVAVGAAQSITVGANQSTSVGANQSTDVGGNRSVQVGGEHSTEVGKGRTATIAKDDAVQVGKNFVLQAGDSITLKTGDASITMKKDGTIQIKGKDITITGSGKIGIKASGDMVLKGSKIAQN